MSEVCDRVLMTDNSITFAMIVDERGQIKCEKTQAGEKYSMPREMVHQIGGVWASVVGSIFKKLSEFHGRFEYVIIKNQKITTIGMNSEKGYVIFTTRDEDLKSLIEKVKSCLV